MNISNSLSLGRFHKKKKPPVNPPSPPAGGWWLPTGLAASKCKFAYAAKGATDLASSLINLNSPGTNDATYDTAPGWDTVNGWGDFLTDGACIKTLVTPVTVGGAQDWSFIIKYNAINTANWPAIFGTCNYIQDYCLIFLTHDSNNYVTYGNDGATAHSQMACSSSGVVGFIGRTLYADGVAGIDLIPESPFDGNDDPYGIWIGTYNNGGNLYNQKYNGYISSIAAYDKEITEEQWVSIMNNMP